VKLIGTATVTKDGKDENLSLEGMSEIHRYDLRDSTHSRLEVIQMYMHGNSALFSGPINLVTPNEGCRRVPWGEISPNSASAGLPFILKTPHGELRTDGIIPIEAHNKKITLTDASFRSSEERALIDSTTGKKVGSIRRISLQVTGKFEHPASPWFFYLPRGANGSR
jgi:hypothetical protein